MLRVEQVITYKRSKNNSNSTEVALRVETNLPGISAACAIFITMYNKMFDLENEGQVHGAQHSE